MWIGGEQIEQLLPRGFESIKFGLRFYDICPTFEWFWADFFTEIMLLPFTFSDGYTRPQTPGGVQITCYIPTSNLMRLQTVLHSIKVFLYYCVLLLRYAYQCFM